MYTIAGSLSATNVIIPQIKFEHKFFFYVFNIFSTNSLDS